MEITLKLLVVDWLRENYPNHRLLIDHWDGVEWVSGHPNSIVDIGRVNALTYNLSLNNHSVINAADPDFFTKLKEHIDGLLKEHIDGLLKGEEILNLYSHGLSGVSGYSGYSGVSGTKRSQPTINIYSISGSGYCGISGYSGLFGGSCPGSPGLGISGYSGVLNLYTHHSGFSGASGSSGYSGFCSPSCPCG
jgi:hypothetical protein